MFLLFLYRKLCFIFFKVVSLELITESVVLNKERRHSFAVGVNTRTVINLIEFVLSVYDRLVNLLIDSQTTELQLYIHASSCKS